MELIIMIFSRIIHQIAKINVEKITDIIVDIDSTIIYVNDNLYLYFSWFYIESMLLQLYCKW